MCSRRTPHAAAGSPGSCRRRRCARRIHTDLSAHCAPALHRHLGCAAPRFRHLEWFHDHVRIEHMLFDGAPVPLRRHDRARPVAARASACPSNRKDAERFAVARLINSEPEPASLAGACSRLGAVVLRQPAIGRAELPVSLAAPQASIDPTPLCARPRRMNRAAGTLAASVLADSADRTLSRLVSQQGDGRAADDVGVVACWSARTAVADKRPVAHRLRDRRLCGGGADRADRHGVPHLSTSARSPAGFPGRTCSTPRRIGAPAALILSGGMGFLAERVRDNPPGIAPTIGGLPAGRVVAAATGAGLMGTVGEAGLLHFRGAYHDPFMYLPGHHASASQRR